MQIHAKSLSMLIFFYFFDLKIYLNKFHNEKMHISNLFLENQYFLKYYNIHIIS